MAINRKQTTKGKVDMNLYQPDSDTSAPPQGAMATPAKRACEEIKRHVGILDRFLHDLDLQQAEQERFDKLNEQNASLFQKIEDMGVWMHMIKEALEHHDKGELSSRQFANEVDAAIKGWEAL